VTVAGSIAKVKDGRVSAAFGRRRFLEGAALLGAAGAAGVLPAAAVAGDRLPEVERVTFDLPGLDPAHDGLRVAQLSDLHLGPKAVPGFARAAIEQANAFEPDLVVLTGDYLSHRPSDVADVREHLGGLRGPVLAVLGNHDVWLDPRGAADALRSHGYEVLENAWTRVRLRGVPFTVVGVGDHLTGRDDVATATRGLPAAAAAPLVLAHGPRSADKLRGLDRPALCLSGHTHGGQINLPIVTPLLLAAMREPYARGHYRVGQVHLYVNRGIGSSGLRVRVNSPAEVTLSTLRRLEPA
jgi:predicted MPP superfamily phosphohydrolase